MGKYYCDYCDVHLTHDSASVRKAHNSGRNHLTNVREYYASLGSDKAQDLIDQIAARYEGGGGGMARQLPMGPGFQGPPGGAPPMGMAPPPGEYLFRSSSPSRSL
ncbi:U1 zinc finger-domain-containing protein [Leucosporidium creatinivorum]|uniref:U1 zinc finger-domain-containing protein n=1 Tax=Leucosporidium creatinivorum TaxID=106004 RepID=A0A1Y2G220_9BASI|nr:U1 zinc finger-domain-containing protein [Leucosporidium creatinivorum]